VRCFLLHRLCCSDQFSRIYTPKRYDPPKGNTSLNLTKHLPPLSTRADQRSNASLGGTFVNGLWATGILSLTTCRTISSPWKASNSQHSALPYLIVREEACNIKKDRKKRTTGNKSTARARRRRTSSKFSPLAGRNSSIFGKPSLFEQRRMLKAARGKGPCFQADGRQGLRVHLEPTTPRE